MFYKMTLFLLIFIIYNVLAVLSQDPRNSPDHYCYLLSRPDFTVFNLTAIQHDHNDSIVRLNDYEHLRVHFCRPLKDPCNGKEGYAICLHFRKQEIGVGREPPKVTIESGKIMFRYTGDQCNGSTEAYTVDIEMKCNFATTDKIDVDLDVVYNRNKCGFQLAVETSAACANKRETPCKIADETSSFDLSPLMNLGDNYRIKINRSLSIILNVCHSLIYGEHFHKCNHDTMVCLVDATNPEETSYTRLGDVNDEVRFSTSGGSVFLDLTSDTPCETDGGDGMKTINTTIEFVCRENARYKSPKYSSGLGTCHYRIVWETILGCNEEVLTRLSKKDQRPCEIMNPLTAELFDLSHLEHTVHTSRSLDSKSMYEFSVCTPLPKTRCTKSGTGIHSNGVCKYGKVDKSIGLPKGLANADVIWSRDFIYLNYTGGMACGSNLRSYTTIIFRCSYYNIIGISEDNPCSTTITWSAFWFCSRVCATQDYSFSLTKLKRSSANYLIPGHDNSTKFHMNVCKPLVEDNFVNCTDDTGFCKVVYDDNGTRISETNLGYAEFGLQEEEGGRLFMRYVNGSVCEEDRSKRITTEVTYACDAETSNVMYLCLGIISSSSLHIIYPRYRDLMRGTPTFSDYSNCQYNFTWNSAYLCEAPDIMHLVYCFLRDSVNMFNVSQLINNTLLEFTRSDSHEDFHISICGNTTQCSGSFVCKKEKPVENVFKLKPDGPEHLVTFYFQNEADCKDSPDSLYDSVLKVWCNMWEGVAEVFLISEGECSAELNWVNERIGNETDCPVEDSFESRNIEGETETGVPLPAVIVISSIISGFIVLIIIGYCYRYGYRRTICWKFIRFNKYQRVRLPSEPTDDLPLEERL